MVENLGRLPAVFRFQQRKNQLAPTSVIWFHRLAVISEGSYDWNARAVWHAILITNSQHYHTVVVFCFSSRNSDLNAISIYSFQVRSQSTWRFYFSSFFLPHEHNNVEFTYEFRFEAPFTYTLACTQNQLSLTSYGVDELSGHSSTNFQFLANKFPIEPAIQWTRTFNAQFSNVFAIFMGLFHKVF